MAETIYHVLIDIFHGCKDSITGLAFIRQLDQDDEYEKYTAPTPRPKTVMQMRREREGAIIRPAEQVVRHRERVWKRVLQCAGVNISIILLHQVLSFIFSFIIGLFTDGIYGKYITIVLLLPIFLITRILMALWFSDIAGACLRQLKLPDPPPIDFRIVIADIIVSTILGVFFLIQGCLAEYLPIPTISTVLMLLHMTLLNSMYCFEYFWSSRSVKIGGRINNIEKRWPYFIGFGIPLTVMTSLSSNMLVNGCIFAILFPFFIISTYQARWTRSSVADKIPKFRIFLPAQTITDKFSSMVSSYLLPSQNVENQRLNNATM